MAALQQTFKMLLLLVMGINASPHVRGRSLQGLCVMQKDCSISAWCNQAGYETYCANHQATCPEPWCTRDSSQPETTAPPEPEVPETTTQNLLPEPGACTMQKDCSISAWCNQDAYEAYCAAHQQTCPEPQCTRSGSSQTPSPTSTSTTAAALETSTTPSPTSEAAPSPTPSPPSGGGCTGDSEVDAILAKANLQSVTGLDDSEIYTWDGFCQALRAMEFVNKALFAGTGEGAMRVAQVLSNVASLLAQCMWESGGDAPWSACDENNYSGSSTAACTQRSDGQRYDSLTSPPACEVDLEMQMTAETYASWTPGPMKCEPGTPTEGCCWWGRGAIQTTGPHNYKMLQDEVVSELPALAGVDLCANPEAICQNEQLKWLGALYYWTSVVQTSVPFETSLYNFVVTGFSDEGSVVGGASFNAGTGGMVNNGYWGAQAHGNPGRMSYFHNIINALKEAGMGAGLEVSDPIEPPSGCQSCSEEGTGNCYVASWAVPCFEAASKSACESASGEFCG